MERSSGRQRARSIGTVCASQAGGRPHCLFPGAALTENLFSAHLDQGVELIWRLVAARHLSENHASRKASVKVAFDNVREPRYR